MPVAATATGLLHVRPSSVERLATTSTTPPPDAVSPSHEISQVWCRKSKATEASLPPKYGPAGVAATVDAGRKPCRQECPPSWLTAKPILLAPPLTMRPTWNAETVVRPNENVSGSTSVRCCAAGDVTLVYGSSLIRTTRCWSAPAGVTKKAVRARAAMIDNSPARPRRRFSATPDADVIVAEFICVSPFVRMVDSVCRVDRLAIYILHGPRPAAYRRKERPSFPVR